jgi:hypothetical protein
MHIISQKEKDIYKAAPNREDFQEPGNNLLEKK